MLKIFVLLVFFAILQANCKECTDSQSKDKRNCIVRLKSGRIRGDCSNPNYDAYTRIPYAKPPIGDLRFESPQPVNPWGNIRNATDDVAKCVQYTQKYNTLVGTEDCLYAYVYVPKNKSECAKPRNPLMVIIWIYPGSFQIGSADNSPDLIMLDGGTILVTIGYRTGPAGFLSTNDFRIPGNMGLKDQRLAIDWVERNIAAFGGDPKQIMLLGNAAGAASVEFHMITGNNKVKAFGALSGSVLNPWAFTKKPEIPAKRLGKLLNCPFKKEGDAFKKCMQAQPVETLWLATIEMVEFYLFSTALFRPTIERRGVPDAFLTKDPVDLIKRGRFKNKPYLVGTVKGEGAYLASNLMQLNGNKTEAIEELNERWYEVCPLIFFYDETKTLREQRKICDQLKTKYMCNKKFNLDSYELLEHMFDDEYFNKGISKSVKLHRKAGQKVYRYIADMPTRYNSGNVLAKYRLDLCFGSVHTADALGILPLDLKLPKQAATSVEVRTRNNLIKLIKSMVSNQNPIYNKIQLPANVNDNAADQCLYFTYGKQRIGDCKFDEVNCKNPRSIKCT